MSHPFQSYTWRREKGQTVYVFGAGASAAESTEGNQVPTNADLLERIVDDDDDIVPAHDRSRIESLLNSLHYGKEYPPTFEEVFTIVEASLAEERYFKGVQKADLLNMKDSLLMAAGSMITKTLPRVPRVHNRFVKNLFQGSSNNKNTSFLDFNYDISLDRALTTHQQSAGDIDYGCYFRSFDVNYKEPEARWEGPEPGKELFLLKLHGSFNWLWCPTCNFLRIHPDQDIGLESIRSGKPCPRCKGSLEPLIIPPAWLKSYRNTNVATIWRVAEFLLSQAEQLVFVGYSLPDADLNLRALLKRTMSFSKPRITVVSSSPEGEDNDCFVRYRRFFGKVDWIDEGFREFSKAPTHGTG